MIEHEKKWDVAILLTKSIHLVIIKFNFCWENPKISFNPIFLHKTQSMTCELQPHIHRLWCAVASCDVRAEPILVELVMCMRSIFRRVNCDCKFATLLCTYNEVGRNFLIFFNDFILELEVGPKCQKLYIRVSNLK